MPVGESATRHARYQLTQREDEDALTQAIVELASQYGRYGYRRITALLKRDGWQVGKDRVERIWRREGLKVPQRQKPRGRLWFNDGSCVRLRPEHANHVWSYDFVSAKTYDGRTVRMLSLIDEHSRECLMIRSERRWSSAKVIEALADVMVVKGVPTLDSVPGCVDRATCVSVDLSWLLTKYKVFPSKDSRGLISTVPSESKTASPPEAGQPLIPELPSPMS